MSQHNDKNSHHLAHPSAMQRFFHLMRQERGDMVVLVTYTMVAGLTALAVPLATQALVNIVAAGVLVQPLVVLTILVFLGMIVTGILQLMKLSLVERLQQRVFAKVALEMAHRMVNVRVQSVHGEYAPELINRFFDVLTIQKTLSKLLLDGLTVSLQAFVGLVLLAVYSPLLLGFDILILMSMAFIIGVLGIGGLRTSIVESKEKYRVADWLEELARCHIGLKLHADGDYLMERADLTVVKYIKARQKHFAVYYRQAAGSYFFQAFASAGVLAIGGWLVINRQLTLGQLVAAQIIVVSVLASLDKLVRQADQVFDLLTGLDKVGHVTDLVTERTGGYDLPGGAHLPGVVIKCHGIRFSYSSTQEVLRGIEFDLKSGDRVSLVGASGAGKSTLAMILCGLEEPTHGTVELDGFDVRALDLVSLRREVTMVGYTNEIFEGSLEENVRAGREWVTHQDVWWALELAQLSDEIARMPQGTSLQLVSAGMNFSRGQIQRLLLARAVAGRPRLLILDEAFTGIDERTAMAILDNIYAPENTWTIVDISHDSEVVRRSSRIDVLSEGRIVESGTPDELASQESSAFRELFPFLTARVLAERASR